MNLADQLTELEARTVEALTRLDGAALAKLAAEVSSTSSATQLLWITPGLAERHRVLGSLLRHSERNLRLLRRSHLARIEQQARTSPPQQGL
ncbi:hypothetical protein [Silvibacterium sp.]|uniref:hypothetical protein n=1 Tax=Silvibacterium sp. TaxID=1964179 RepID=UPI0039E6D981